MNKQHQEKIAVIATVKAPVEQLQMFVNYHLKIGIDEIILFFDDPFDESIDIFAKCKNVTVIPCSLEYWTQRTGKRPQIILARQTINVNEGVKIATNKNCNWMTHIDCDELIYPFRNIKQILRDCQTDGLKPAGMEAVPEQETYDHIFMPTLFKKMPNKKQILVAKILGCSKSFLEGQYFKGHTISKMIIKISPKIQEYGIHRPEKCDKSTVIEDTNEIMLLHYDSIGVSNWKKKFETRSQELVKEENISQYFGKSRFKQYQDYVQARNEGDFKLTSLYKSLYIMSKREKLILSFLGMLERIIVNQDLLGND